MNKLKKALHLSAFNSILEELKTAQSKETRGKKVATSFEVGCLYDIISHSGF